MKLTIERINRGSALILAILILAVLTAALGMYAQRSQMLVKVSELSSAKDQMRQRGETLSSRIEDIVEKALAFREAAPGGGEQTVIDGVTYALTPVLFTPSNVAAPASSFSIEMDLGPDPDIPGDTTNAHIKIVCFGVCDLTTAAADTPSKVIATIRSRSANHVYDTREIAFQIKKNTSLNFGLVVDGSDTPTEQGLLRLNGDDNPGRHYIVTAASKCSLSNSEFKDFVRDQFRTQRCSDTLIPEIENTSTTTTTRALYNQSAVAARVNSLEGEHVALALQNRLRYSVSTFLSRVPLAASFPNTSPVDFYYNNRTQLVSALNSTFSSQAQLEATLGIRAQDLNLRIASPGGLGPPFSTSEATPLYAETNMMNVYQYIDQEKASWNWSAISKTNTTVQTLDVKTSHLTKENYCSVRAKPALKNLTSAAIGTAIDNAFTSTTFDNTFTCPTEYCRVGISGHMLTVRNAFGNIVDSPVDISTHRRVIRVEGGKPTQIDHSELSSLARSVTIYSEGSFRLRGSILRAAMTTAATPPSLRQKGREVISKGARVSLVTKGDIEIHPDTRVIEVSDGQLGEGTQYLTQIDRTNDPNELPGVIYYGVHFTAKGDLKMPGNPLRAMRRIAHFGTVALAGRVKETNFTFNNAGTCSDQGAPYTVYTTPSPGDGDDPLASPTLPGGLIRMDYVETLSASN